MDEQAGEGMTWHGWPRVRLHIPDSRDRPRDVSGTAAREAPAADAVTALAPLIISASRSTDIPAFYGEWFRDRLRKGYAKWINPWNGSSMFVSFQNARVFVFWSKNPGPFLSWLAEMTRLGYQYIVLFTLNDYEKEGVEPNLPLLEDRIRTFQDLSRIAGKGRVVWRWDPLLLSDRLDVPGLLDRVRRVGDAIAPFTERMAISFIDIARYPRVARNLRSRGCGDIREFSPAEELELAAGLRDLNRSWGLTITACGEERDFSEYGIGPGRCISRDHLLHEFGGDPVLRQFLDPPPEGENPARTPGFLKDPGQRRACGCVVSKDIGQYATCPHLCAYCYANTTPERVKKRYGAYRIRADQGTYGESITE
ncbi:MAG TPA: DUF1848 domain-containing protein [Methanomicrobiales archaeon]|nr:DUF1848 domain-containing protein [Methanomicrobiales archaeon]